MKKQTMKKCMALLLASLTVFTVSCSVPGIGKSGDSEKGEMEGQSFAEAHDAFQTTLTTQDSDSDSIPEPPEGVFDLVKYPSKVVRSEEHTS